MKRIFLNIFLIGIFPFILSFLYIILANRDFAEGPIAWFIFTFIIACLLYYSTKYFENKVIVSALLKTCYINTNIYKHDGEQYRQVRRLLQDFSFLGSDNHLTEERIFLASKKVIKKGYLIKKEGRYLLTEKGIENLKLSFN